MSSFLKFLYDKYKNIDIVENRDNNNKMIVNINHNNILKNIHEASFILELFISAIHIIKKILKEYRELIAQRQSLDPELTIHDDDFININIQLKSLKDEIKAIYELYTWRNKSIFHADGWSWNIDNREYTWSFDLLSLINQL